MLSRCFQIVSCLPLLLISLLCEASPAQSAPIELLRGGTLLRSFESIQAAVDAAVAGDTIRLRQGVYHENIVISGKHATSNNPFVLEAAPGETVVLDGADAGLQQPDNGRWNWDESEEAWVATVPWTGRPGRSLLTWASDSDGNLIAAHHNQDYFLRGARGDALWRTQERVRLRLKSGGDPNATALNVGTAEAIIMVKNSSGWVIRNLTLQHAGFAGVHLDGKEVSDVTLEGLTVWNSFRGISSEDYGGGGPSSRIAIRYCRILNNWDFSWPWREGYRDSNSASSDEGAPIRGSGIHLRAIDSEVAYCEVAGQWDGMQLQGRNLDVYRNIIHHTRDDMIELESNNSRNVRVFENIGFNLFSGLSIVSNPGGPLYIYRNFIQSNLLSYMHEDNGPVYRYGYPLKFGNDWGPGAERVYIYQNTFDSLGRSIFVAARSNPEKWKNIEWVNNIFNRAASGPVGIEGMGSPTQGIRWEGNLFTRADELNRLASIAPEYANAGRLGRARLVDTVSTPPDLRIQPDSDAVASGSTRPQELGWPDSVTATAGSPDIGALPLGSAPLSAGTGQPLYMPWLDSDEVASPAPDAR